MSTNEETTESNDDKQEISDHKSEDDEELNALLDSKSIDCRFLKETISEFRVFPLISTFESLLRCLNRLIWSKGALNDFQSKTKISQSKTVTAADDVSKPLATTSTASAIPTTSKDPNSTADPLIEGTFEANLNTDFAKFDEMFSPLINSDPDLKDHWTKLTQSCADAGLT